MAKDWVVVLGAIVVIWLVLHLVYGMSEGSTQASPDLVDVVSTVDGKSYKVLNTDNKQEAADLIASTRGKLQSVLNHMLFNLKSLPEKIQPTFTHLSSVGFPPISELDARTENTVAFTLNKDRIFICLRKSPGGEALADAQDVFVVLAHELIHRALPTYSASDSAGHTIHSPEFKENEAAFLDTAVEMGLLSPTKSVGDEYCGILIPDSTNAQ
jgi:hypothetical protein